MYFHIIRYEPKNENTEYYKMTNNQYARKRKREYLINHYKYNVDTNPEKYFYALLLLFQPWRDTCVLRNGCETYAESFFKVVTELKNAEDYHNKYIDLKKAKDEAEELIRQQIEINEGEQCKNDNESQEGDPDPVYAAIDELKQIDHQLPQKTVAMFEAELNIDQKRIFDRITKTILYAKDNSNAPILRLYVSGEGGTGKSHLIEAIRCWVKEAVTKRVAVLAPTGIAAHSINGLTIHRMFSLPVEHGNVPKYRSLSDRTLKTLRDEFNDIELIIIDEISMVSNVQFLYIHMRLAEICNTEDTPNGYFGRKHILLFGDLLQLEPVKGQPPFKTLNDDEIHILIGCLGKMNLWKELFEYDELTINMRQRNDETYGKILKRIRVGYTTNDDREILSTRKIKFTESTIEGRLNELCDYVSKMPSEAICMFPTRNMCNILNTQMLERLNGSQIIELLAHDSIDCKPYLRKKVDKILNVDDEDLTRSGGLPRSISVKIGAKVMVTKNIDVTTGLVNGSIGTIKSISRNIDNPSDIDTITIRLASSEKECIIERFSLKFEVMDKVYVIRKQFPVCLSYAITIHKSQGLSLKHAVIDAGNQTFADGQIYVAFSRVTTLNGLHIINFDPSWIKASGEAIMEYNRLRKKYRPDLTEFEFRNNTERRIIDDKWFYFDEPVRVQEGDINKTKASIQTNIRGLQNNDGVSSYCISVLQCLFNCEILQSQLLSLQADHVMRHAILAYFNNHTVDVLGVRRFVNDRYIVQNEQNVSEFIHDLFCATPELKKMIEFQVKNLKTCSHCGYSISEMALCTTATLPVKIAQKTTVTLQQIFDEAYNNQRSKVEANCVHDTCNGKFMYQRISVEAVSLFLVVQLHIYENKGNGILKKVDGYKIKSVSTAVVNFGGSSYKTVGAIFHSGNSIECGHYFSFIRHKAGWLKINDDLVEKKSWPYNAKEAYILFLQRQQ